MRDFLMELYLLHGEREFGFIIDFIGSEGSMFTVARREYYIMYLGYVAPIPYKLTTKAIEYIKNLDNP